MKVITILIQIIENSLSLRVAACLAFLMPTALFYIMVIVAAKDPTSFKSMQEKEIMELKKLYNERTVRQKDWGAIIKFPPFPNKWKRRNLNEHVNVRDNSLKKIKQKNENKLSSTFLHRLNEFYGIEGEKKELKKQELEKIKRLHPFLKRNIPETNKEKILNWIIMTAILLIIILTGLI
jgi:hypothetical protein